MPSATELPRPLPDGLLMRTAGLTDAAELADFNATMHADDPLPAAAQLAEWTRDLFDGLHPHFDAERDVTVVEDTATGRIVSALFLIPQVWSYGSVAMPVGQPELIATHPDYRRRGLIRTQFEVVHQWSAAAGHLWQFISGIPWYYRQFGYGYGLDLPPRPVLWLGERAPEAPTDITVRPATTADVTFVADVEAQMPSGTVLGAVRGAGGFALEVARRPGGLLACEVLVIERAGDPPEPIGYAAHTRLLNDGLVSLRALEMRPGHSWLAPTAAVIAHLHRWVRAHPDGAGRGIRFAVPSSHPALRCAATRLGTGPPGSYGLYVRIPDIAAFVRAAAPELEARLAASPAVGWTGDLRIDLYTGGLRIGFDSGKLAAVESWTRPAEDTASDEDRRVDASLRVDELMPVLLGSRRIGELERTTPDCIVDTDAGALLLDVLFPPMPMSTWEFC